MPACGRWPAKVGEGERIRYDEFSLPRAEQMSTLRIREVGRPRWRDGRKQFADAGSRRSRMIGATTLDECRHHRGRGSRSADGGVICLVRSDTISTCGRPRFTSRITRQSRPHQQRPVLLDKVICVIRARLRTDFIFPPMMSSGPAGMRYRAVRPACSAAGGRAGFCRSSLTPVGRAAVHLSGVKPTSAP